MLVELLYCSISVAPQLTNVDIGQLLASARRRNLAEGVTGMLIYHQGEFVQILEGRKQSVENLYMELELPQFNGHFDLLEQGHRLQ